MAEHAKQARTTAKGVLTKSCIRVSKAIDQKLSIEIIQNRFSNVNKQWTELLEKNEQYLQLAYPEGEIPSSEEDWLEVVTDKFDEIEIAVDGAIKEHVRPKLDSNLESADRLYTLEEQALIAMITELQNMCDTEDATVQMIKEYKTETKEQFTCFRETQRNLALLGKGPGDSATKIQTEFNKVIAKAGTTVEKRNESNKLKHGNQQNGTHLKLERVKLPIFNGKARDYPRFKTEFEKQVAPMIANDSAAYVLKSCLIGEALELVKNVDDDIDEMWGRLEARFPTSKITGDIMAEIRRVKQISDGESKKFTEFVNLIEGSFRDLERIDMQGEISNSTVVGMIEEKLPRSIFNLWCLKVCEDNSLIDDKDKFKDLLAFLLTHKRAVEYGSHELRTGSTGGTAINKQGQIHVGQSNTVQLRSTRESCWIHGSASYHPIWKCKEFQAKSVGERVKLATENNACLTCLLVSCPGSEQCKSGFKCLEKDCNETHNQLLHRRNMEGSTSHAENNQLSSAPFLPLQTL